jgi:hypothetical protein
MTTNYSPGSPHATETIKAHASIPFLMTFAMTNRMKVLHSRRLQVLNSSDSVDEAFSWCTFCETMIGPPNMRGKWAGMLESCDGWPYRLLLLTTTSGALETTLAFGHRTATRIVAHHCCRRTQAISHLPKLDLSYCRWFRLSGSYSSRRRIERSSPFSGLADKHLEPSRVT